MKQEKNKEVLQQAISDLRTQKAPKGLWLNIETNLKLKEEQNEQNLKKAIAQLPLQKLERNLWSTIDKSLHEDKKAKTLSLPKVYKFAAAILLLLGSISVILKQTHKSNNIIISSEIIEEETGIYDVENSENETIQNEIDLLCSQLPENCNNPIILELKDQLEEVSLQYQDIKDLLETDNTPELQHYLLRIENEKAEIEKELLTIIINS